VRCSRPLEHLSHAVPIGYVSLESQSTGECNPIKCLLRAGHGHNDPSLPRKELDHRATKVARAEHDRAAQRWLSAHGATLALRDPATKPLLHGRGPTVQITTTHVDQQRHNALKQLAWVLEGTEFRPRLTSSAQDCHAGRRGLRVPSLASRTVGCLPGHPSPSRLRLGLVAGLSQDSGSYMISRTS
jgi:hypothetical protein